ncbi:unnamed protein product [Closterium sp. NIES-64]|nr:unnamed protein product [Closterium sp. NIES-64]
MDCPAGRAGLPIVLALLAALLGRADARMTDYPIPFRADRRLLVTDADAASQGKLLFIVLCGATVVLFIVFVALLALLISLHYRAARSSAPAETAKKLPLRAIWRATSSLGVAQQVGEGDFGRAYLGEHRGEAWLVVVSTSDNIDIIKAFRREVDTLGPVSHPSLVRLVGSPGLPVLRAAGGHSTQPGGSTAPPALLRGPSFGALVSHPPLCLYPTCYRPHPPDAALSLSFERRVDIAHSLAAGLHHLHCCTDPPLVHWSPTHHCAYAALSLSFERRVDIAHSLAAGLHHLHCCVDPPIVHRQVNSGNVLLQPRWPYARLANVGEVKGLPYAPTINGRRNRAAYIDPEYFIALRASAASDVYSFGIILLELLTGQPAEQIDPATGRRAYLNIPALTALIRAHHLPPLLDPALPFPPTPAPSALQALASLAADCTVRYAKQRPDASAVLLQMEGIREAVQNGLAVQGRAGDHLSLSIPGSVAEAEARGRFGSRGGELVGGSGREWGSAGELYGAQGSVGWSAGERSLGGGGSERERGGELARERGGSGRSHGGSDRERGSGTSGGGSFLDGSSAYLYGEQPRGIVSSSSYPQVLSSLAHQPPSPHPPASPHTPFKRHSLPRTHTAPVSPSLLPTLPLFEAPHFSFHALQQATEGFAPHRVHRQAHLGEVYLGTIKTVGEVMVVRQMAPGAGEGGSTGGGGSFGRDKRGVGGRSGELGRGGEWGTGEEARERERERERDMWVSRTIAEAHALRRVVHRNLVTLLGFTVTTDQCLLTYTHTDAPDLFHSLHLPEQALQEPMGWQARVHVAHAVGEGLLQLHVCSHPHILHGALVSRNVLLPHGQPPQLFDFGMSHFAEARNDNFASPYCQAYMAPKCGTTGETDKTTDMYAYGVLLLELVSGKLPYDDDRDPVQLSDWARQQDWSSSDSIKELVDPLLEGMYNEDEVLILASLAMRCINVDKRERPTVKEQRLRRKQQLDDGPGSALAEEAPRKAKKRAGGAAAAAEGAAQQPQPQLDTIPAQLPAQIPETPPSSATLLDPVPIDVPSASDQPSLSTSSALSASAVSPADSPADELAGLTQRVAKSVRDVRGYAKLNVSTATVQQVCEMVDHNLAPWTRIPQIRDGMGAAGMVAPSLVKTISQRARFMSCAGHVRVVDGSVYFRLGGFITVPYRVRRFLQTVQTIQRAVDFHNLAAVRAEFFVNTCDLPISYDSDVGGSRPVGFPFFSTRVVPGSVDVAIPDPLDLPDNMDLPENVEVPWEEKENRAVFRGTASSFPFEDSQNWRAHPLIRLHRMAEARPDLLDVKLIGWSRDIDGDVRKRMEADGVAMVGRPTLTADPPMSKFKYQIVSGLPSSHQTCAILARGEQVAIRQASPYAEFFTPLLKPYVNFIPANRHFDNLIEKLRWAQSHDNHVHHMVAAAKRAAKWACTRSGHTLYWAILLIKYSKNALQDPSTIKAPVKTLCQDPLDPALLEMAGLAAPSSPTSSPSLSLPDSWPPVCSRDNIDRSAQPKCVYYCQKGVIPGKSFVWVSAEALKAGVGAQSA